MSPKTCPTCGTKAFCINSRPSGDYTIRRYECVAEHRYTTAEFVVEVTGDLTGKKINRSKIAAVFKAAKQDADDAALLRRVRDLIGVVA